MPTNPPTNPLRGAVYVDQSTNIVWVWTGVYWLQADGTAQNYNSQVTPTTAIVPGLFTEPSPDDWIPFVSTTAPTYPGCGQIWVNTTTTPAVSSVWDCTTSTWISISGAAGGDTNSIVSTAQPAVRTDGSALQAGDLWVDNLNNKLYYYSGSAFVPFSGTVDTHSIFSSVQPTVRPDGTTPFLAGDMWVDSDDNILYYYNGTSWVSVKADDPSHQLATSAPLTRSDGTPLQTADLYTNSSTNTLFYWDGAAWQRYNDTHAIEASVAPLVRPDGAALSGGDQWFNPTTDVLSVYESGTSSWIAVNGGDTHSIWSGTAPPLRADGSALINGDMWINTSTDLYGYHDVKVWNAGSWENIGDLDTHSFVAAGAPTLTTRPNGDTLQVGDQYVNSTDNTIWYYNGSWVQTKQADDTHSFYGIVPPALTTRPDGSALQGGDQYIDNTTNYLYFWDGIVWTQVGTNQPDTHSFVYAAATPVITTRPDTTPLQPGDMYVSETTDKLFYRDNANTWVPLSTADTHSFTGTAAPTLTTRPDGTALLAGDQFINTTNNALYYYDGGAWDPVSDFHSYSGNLNPTLTTRTDGTPLLVGDQFVNTATSTLFYYNGTGWTPFANADTHSIFAALVPSTRADGSALINGDMWVNSAMDALGYHDLKVWHTSAWHDVGTPDTQATPSPSAPTTRVDGSALQNGDQWVDTNYGPRITYTYDSGTTSFAPNGDVSVVASLPASGDYDNQLLILNTTNVLYRYDATATAWIQVS